MKVTLELKFIEFEASDRTIKKQLKQLEKEGWMIEQTSAKRARIKRYRLKRMLQQETSQAV